MRHTSAIGILPASVRLRGSAGARWCVALLVMLCCAQLASACGGSSAGDGAVDPLAVDAGPAPSPPESIDAGAEASCAAAGGVVGDAVEGAAACDLVSGCGCAPGETCRLDADAELLAACGPLATDARGPYAACSDDSQCPAQYSCISSVCKKHCRAPDDCGWEGARCVGVTVGGEALSGAGYCPADCDVVSPQSPRAGFGACGSGLQCVPAGGGTDCVALVFAGVEGDFCNAAADCAAGLRCSAARRCERWCRLGSDECGPELKCVALDATGAISAGDLGACACVPPAGAACDIAFGCGCDDGQTCGYTAAGVGCRSLSADAVGAYELCADDSDCPELHSCISSVCQRQCNTAADCDWPGAACIPVRAWDTGEPLAGFNFCQSNCDPLSPQDPAGGFRACGAGQTCFPEQGVGGCFSAGVALGEGEPCEEGICGPGLFCSGLGRCTRWCEVGGSSCAPGLECEGFGPDYMSGQRELGRCVCRPSDGSTCDPSTDCGCELGTTCDYSIDQRAFVCRSLAASPLAPHANCTSDLECPALHGCFGGLCKRLCTSSADCTASGSSCVAANYEGAEFPGWNFCTVACDPLTPFFPSLPYESCGFGNQCFPFSDGPDCVAFAGSQFEGFPCTDSSDCQPGLFCGSGDQCQPWCAVGETECANGSSCVGFEPPLAHEGREYGRCLCTPSNGSECDPATDCGCDPGTTCRALEEPDAFGCFSLAAASVAPYASCGVDSQCPALHSCIHGVCKKHCDSADDCGGEGTSCLPLGPSGAGLGYCAHDCDPVSPTASLAGFPACGADAQCFPFESGFDCARAGAGSSGDTCDAVDDCAPGHFCSDALECQAWCHVGASECLVGSTCFPASSVSGEGAEAFGLCTACSDACGPPNDICEDGGPSSVDALCEPGTDCTDCGVF